MKLFEHETKNILSAYGIPTPRGELATNPTEALKAAMKLTPPFALKAQVLVAGRGKAGGILFAENTEEVEKTASNLFTKTVNGISVKHILIEERIRSSKELYLSIAIDRSERKHALISSSRGGVEIEDTAKELPSSVTKTLIDPLKGLPASDARKTAKSMGYAGNQLTELASIVKKLYAAATAYDAELVEINPLAEYAEGTFVALDARLIVDNNALFRHPELEKKFFDGERENTLEEIEAAKRGLAYVRLEGNIGVVGNGAGLVMATLDMIKYFGGNPADFLDLGGGADVNRIVKAIEIVMGDPNVKTVFVNILGGLTRCDEVAKAIVETRNSTLVKKPFVIRLVGTNEEEGARILEESHISVLDSMESAAKHAVEMAKETR